MNQCDTESMRQHLKLLHSLLEERLRIVADRERYLENPSAHLHALMEKSQELTTLFDAVRNTLDPMLVHYFERQSYQKALDWMAERLR